MIFGSFVDLPTLLLHNRSAVMPALLWLTSLCSVADAAAHGLAVNLLTPEERGLGNGLQTAGLMIGHLVGGGLMVILAGVIGFKSSILIIAVLILLTIPVIALYKEQPVDTMRTLNFQDVLEFFRQPRKLRWLAVVAAMPIGASIMTPALETLLVDRGFALKEIGFVLGVLASAAGVVGGIVGGLAVKRMGRERSFHMLMLFCAFCLALILLHRIAIGRPLLYLIIALPNIGIMARATVLHVLMMDRCRGHAASTDFTIQYTVQQLSRFAFATVGAFLAGACGSTLVFVLAPVLTLMVLALATQLLDHRDFQVTRRS
jgi:MFS transporter, PAT family, beta-lactamase induction signal transducer AmpG